MHRFKSGTGGLNDDRKGAGRKGSLEPLLWLTGKALIAWKHC